ncbi:MAG: hypothetical protein KGL39_36330 [Patescibacteria group bacterium]|nr:hypothetical protein [Patescibacteria group bacterium]
MDSESRFEAIEKRLAELEGRTAKQVRFGPRELTPEVPPVDRSKRCMLSGNPETPEHREIDPSTGMQKDYVVLCPQERAKGFVKPVRHSYRHLTCGSTTTMGLALAETYARDPRFYSGTMCVNCHAHFPLNQFKWEDGEPMDPALQTPAPESHKESRDEE